MCALIVIAKCCAVRLLLVLLFLLNCVTVNLKRRNDQRSNNDFKSYTYRICFERTGLEFVAVVVVWLCALGCRYWLDRIENVFEVTIILFQTLMIVMGIYLLIFLSAVVLVICGCCQWWRWWYWLNKFSISFYHLFFSKYNI